MSTDRFPFHYALRVRYVEVDAQHIVYNGHYLMYFDLALTEYMRALGRPVQGGALDYDVVVARAEVDYKASIRYDEIIRIHVKPANVGRSSIDFALRITGDADDDIRAEGRVVWVNTDRATGKSHPLDAGFIAQLQTDGRQELTS